MTVSPIFESACGTIYLIEVDSGLALCVYLADVLVQYYNKFFSLEFGYHGIRVPGSAHFTLCVGGDRWDWAALFAEDKFLTPLLSVSELFTRNFQLDPPTSADLAADSFGELVFAEPPLVAFLRSHLAAWFEQFSAPPSFLPAGRLHVSLAPR